MFSNGPLKCETDWTRKICLFLRLSEAISLIMGILAILTLKIFIRSICVVITLLDSMLNIKAGAPRAKRGPGVSSNVRHLRFYVLQNRKGNCHCCLRILMSFPKKKKNGLRSSTYWFVIVILMGPLKNMSPLLGPLKSTGPHDKPSEAHGFLKVYRIQGNCPIRIPPSRLPCIKAKCKLSITYFIFKLDFRRRLTVSWVKHFNKNGSMSK